jgi:SSS family solute:Na+ symporter
MTAIDWILVIVPLLMVIGLAAYTQRYVKGVADFVSAGRCAGRYLLANARGEAGSGVTNTISNFEMIMISGFIVGFWSKLTIPVALIVGITGFVFYRYRQTRAMTIAQFFEMRYSRKLRLYMGILAFVSGVLNYGIFPLVSSRFFVYFLGLPEAVMLFGHSVPTYILIMAGYMTLSSTLVIFGGQVTLMITDCVEGILTHFVYLVIIIAVFFVISWSQTVDVLNGAPPPGTDPLTAIAMAIQPGHSPVNPFDAFKTSDFNFWFVMIGLFGSVYLTMAWQGGHGFNSAALTPHESRMGNVLGQWRMYVRLLVLTALTIGAMVYLRHPDFVQKSQPAKDAIAAIPSARDGKPVPLSVSTAAGPIGSQTWAEDKKNDSTNTQRQQAVSVALRYMLPAGVKGLFLLIMILGLFAGDGNHIHSWSSIFVQDIIVPLRKEPLSPKTHLLLLRLAVVMVALFAFLFSVYNPLTVSIPMWWAITGVLYHGGAGAIIIGGLYWRRGTTLAAWVSVVSGSVLSVAAYLLNYNWKKIIALLPPVKDGWTQFLGIPLPEVLPNFAWITFCLWILGIVLYVVISLLTCRQPFDLDELLHRKSKEHDDTAVEASGPKPKLLQRLIGIDEHFTRTDRWVSSFIFWWSMALVVIFLAMVGWHYLLPEALKMVGWDEARALSVRMTTPQWTQFWLWMGYIIPGLFSVVTLVWFTIGGFNDMRKFFHILSTRQRDARDDGTVHGHHNLDDEAAASNPAPTPVLSKETVSPQVTPPRR